MYFAKCHGIIFTPTTRRGVEEIVRDGKSANVRTSSSRNQIPNGDFDCWNSRDFNPIQEDFPEPSRV